jgi:hypothetical protein
MLAQSSGLIFSAASCEVITGHTSNFVRSLHFANFSSKNFVSVSVTGKSAHFQAIDIKGKPLDELESKNPSGDTM